MPPTLLIVEDDADLRAVLVRSLDAEGFAASACATGHEFVERVVAAPADVLIIDVGLPDADGRDVCQALRARGITTPVLFLTAKDALPDRLSGFNAGGDDYVIKPFDIEELAVRVHALIRRAAGADIDRRARGAPGGSRGGTRSATPASCAERPVGHTELPDEARSPAWPLDSHR